MWESYVLWALGSSPPFFSVNISSSLLKEHKYTHVEKTAFDLSQLQFKSTLFCVVPHENVCIPPNDMKHNHIIKLLKF